MAAFHPLRTCRRRATTLQMLSDARPPRWIIVGVTALAACAPAAPPQDLRSEVWELGGNHEALAAVKHAAENCRYTDVKEVVGGHVEPYLHIAIPMQFSAEYECLRQWLKDNDELGFNAPAPSKR